MEILSGIIIFIILSSHIIFIIVSFPYYLAILSSHIIWLYHLPTLSFPYNLTHIIFPIWSGNEYVCLFIAIPSMPPTSDIRYIAISAILPLIFLSFLLLSVSSPQCIFTRSNVTGFKIKISQPPLKYFWYVDTIYCISVNWDGHCMA